MRGAHSARLEDPVHPQCQWRLGECAVPNRLQLSDPLHRGGLLQEHVGHHGDAGAALERHRLVRAVDAESIWCHIQPAVRRLLSCDDHVHCGRQLSEEHDPQADRAPG